nr:unnamed protein product [Digitaria exilis]
MGRKRNPELIGRNSSKKVSQGCLPAQEGTQSSREWIYPERGAAAGGSGGGGEEKGRGAASPAVLRSASTRRELVKAWWCGGARAPGRACEWGLRVWEADGSTRPYASSHS